MRPTTKKGGQKFFVSRQTYWGVDEEEGTVVEVAYGGLDYANPDMLTPKWSSLGEGKEFTDPREAVEAAIAVCEAWRASGEVHAKVAMGATGGNTLPFEPKEYDEARERAEKLWESLPKCEECGKALGKETFSHDLHDDGQFCSERCAEKNYWDMRRQDDYLSPEEIPADWPVQPLKAGESIKGAATCGTCGLSWDDSKSTSMTPTPSARCPFESFHRSQEE